MGVRYNVRRKYNHNQLLRSEQTTIRYYLIISQVAEELRISSSTHDMSVVALYTRNAVSDAQKADAKRC